MVLHSVAYRSQTLATDLHKLQSNALATEPATNSCGHAVMYRYISPVSASSSVNTTVRLPHTITLSNTEIEISETVHNLGSIFDSNLSMKQHIIKTCKAAYIEIRCISSVCQYLTKDAAKTLVSSCILSRLHYCNSLLAGYPQTIIKPLQQVQNSHQAHP